MHECSSLQCLTGNTLAIQAAASFRNSIVKERQQLLGSRRITGFDLTQDLRDIGHALRLRDKQ